MPKKLSRTGPRSNRDLSLTQVQREFFRALAETVDLEEALKRFPRLNRGILRRWFRRFSGEEEEDSPFEAYIDGASRGNPGEAGAGVWVKGDPPNELRRYLGEATNNEAEYHAFLLALEEAHRRGAQRVRLYSDSELLVRQMEGRYKIRSSKLIPLYDRAKELLGQFERFEMKHVSRERNREADRLANEAIDRRDMEV